MSNSCDNRKGTFITALESLFFEQRGRALDSSTETKRKHWGMVAALGMTIGLAPLGAVGCGGIDESSCECTASVNGTERTWACGGSQCINGTSYQCASGMVTSGGTCNTTGGTPTTARTTVSVGYCLADPVSGSCKSCQAAGVSAIDVELVGGPSVTNQPCDGWSIKVNDVTPGLWDIRVTARGTNTWQGTLNRNIPAEGAAVTVTMKPK